MYYPAKDKLQYIHYHVTERKLFYLQLLKETIGVIHTVVGVRLITKKEKEVIDNMYEAQEMWRKEESAKIRKHYEKHYEKAVAKQRKETLTEREAKKKAQAKTNHIVKALYQLVMDQVISKSEAIRISGMSEYRFMKIARSMNP